jgi:hypothetical protein
MVAPIRPNYTINSVDPGQAFLEARAQKQAQEEDARQQAIAQERDAKRQAALEQILGVPSSAPTGGSVGVPAAAAPSGAPAMEATPGYVAPGEAPMPQMPQQTTTTGLQKKPSAEDYLKAAALYPELKDQFTKLAEQRGKEYTQNSLYTAARIATALENNDTETAINLADQMATAAENSGDQMAAQAYRTWGRLAEMDPEGVRDLIGISMAATPGGVDVVKRTFGDEAPAKIRELKARAELAGLKPGTPEYNKFMTTGGGAPTVQIDQRERDEFEKEKGKRDAKFFGDLADQATTIGESQATIRELESVLANIDTGFGARIKQLAGRYGIATEELNEIQAVNAIISRLVPAQRQPGSGTMSDADLQLFKDSLPSIINQPGGNKLIVDTIKRINDYRMEQARIANDVFAGRIERQEGRDKLLGLANPIDEYREIFESSQVAPMSSEVAPQAGEFKLIGRKPGG